MIGRFHTQLVSLLNLTDVLAMNFEGTEYYLSMNIEGVEYYISMT